MKRLRAVCYSAEAAGARHKQKEELLGGTKKHIPIAGWIESLSQKWGERSRDKRIGAKTYLDIDKFG